MGLISILVPGCKHPELKSIPLYVRYKCARMGALRRGDLGPIDCQLVTPQGIGYTIFSYDSLWE